MGDERRETTDPTRRTFLTATRASSAFLCTCFTISLRRSSVRAGITRRMMFPSFVGVNPRSDFWIAFSMVPSCVLSNGWMVIIRGSGALIVAIWFRGVSVP